MINLLPPDNKEQLRRHRAITHTVLISSIAALFFIGLTAALLAAHIHTNAQKQLAEARYKAQQTQLETERRQSLLEEIQQVNADIQTVLDFYEERPAATPALGDIATNLPSEASLNSLSYIRQNRQITITGDAERRSQLVSLKDTFEENKRFATVDFPPSNWVSERDITFLVRLELRNPEQP